MTNSSFHKIANAIKQYPALLNIIILLLTALSLISFLVPLIPIPFPYFLLFAPLVAVTVSRARESGERTCYLIVFFALLTVIAWSIFFLLPNSPPHLMQALTFVFPVAAGVIVFLLWQSVESVFSSLYEMTSIFPRKDPLPNEPVKEFRREQVIAILRLPSIYLCYVILSIAIILEALMALDLAGIKISSEGQTYLIIVLFATTLAYVNRLFTFLVSASGSKRFTYSMLTIFLGILSIGVLTGKIALGPILAEDPMAGRNMLDLTLIVAALEALVGELILRPLTSGIASTLQVSYVLDRTPISAKHAVDSRERFMEAALGLAREAEHEIMISTQTFGLHWWGLQGVLEKRSLEDVTVEIVGPINLKNVPRIFRLLGSGKIDVRCNNRIDKTSIKFMLIDKGEKLLLGFPTGKRREEDPTYYPESREGFVFEDPYETRQYREDFKAIFTDGKKASDAISNELAQCFLDFLWENRAEFEDIEPITEKPRLVPQEGRDKGPGVYTILTDNRPFVTFNWETEMKQVLVSTKVKGDIKRKVVELLKEFVKKCTEQYEPPPEHEYERIIHIDDC